MHRWPSACARARIGSRSKRGFPLLSIYKPPLFVDLARGEPKQHLSEGDYETRYDLGIAYREMELLDDAIDEFRLCVDSPTRRLDSLHMLGLCSLDQGRIDDAVGHLKQALATPGLAAEKGAGLYFDLGRAFEELGDPAAALAAYDAVVAADSGFPGVDDRINSLKTRVATAAPAVPADTDEFESFDDLVAEAEAESEEATPEVYESLDDIISEVEAEDGAEAAAEPEPEPEPPKKSRKKREKKKKKKKISFV